MPARDRALGVPPPHLPRTGNLLCKHCVHMCLVFCCVREGMTAVYCRRHRLFVSISLVQKNPSVWIGCVLDPCEKDGCTLTVHFVHVQSGMLFRNSFSPSFLLPVSAGDLKIVKLFSGSELDSSAPMNV